LPVGAARHLPGRAVSTEMPAAFNVVPDDWLPWSRVLQIIGRESAPAIPIWLARTITSVRWHFLRTGAYPSWIGAALADFTVSNAKLRATGWVSQYSCEAALCSALPGTPA